jgi:hypothetical protein
MLPKRAAEIAQGWKGKPQQTARLMVPAPVREFAVLNRSFSESLVLGKQFNPGSDEKAIQEHLERSTD